VYSPKKKNMSAYEWTRWLDETREKHATIATIGRMSHGEIAKFIVFCRNTCDIVRDNFNCTVTRPGVFFRGCYRMQFEKIGGKSSILGRWVVLPGTDEQAVEAHLHIEYKRDHWFPLGANGSLPTANDSDPWGEIRSIAAEGAPLGENWKQFPGGTRLGWRGPMMREEYLSDCPGVFKTSADEDEEMGE